MVATAVFGAGIAASVLPGSAGADPRTLVVTLATGQTITVTVDVPPGTPIDQIKIPGISTPIVGVSEVSPPSPPPSDQSPVPQPPSASVQTGPDQQQGEAPAAAPQGAGGQAQQHAQKKTGKTHRKARDKVQGLSGTAQRSARALRDSAKQHKAPTRTPGGAPTPDPPAQEPCRSVVLGDDQIQIAVVVDVRIRGAARDDRTPERGTELRGDLVEASASRISEDMSRLRVGHARLHAVDVVGHVSVRREDVRQLMPLRRRLAHVEPFH